MQDKLTDNQAFFHTNSLRENNLTLVKTKGFGKVQNCIHFAADLDGKLKILEGYALEIARIDKFLFLERNIYEIRQEENKFLYELGNILFNGINSSTIKINDCTFEVTFTHTHQGNGEITGIIGTANEISTELRLKEDIKIHKEYFSQLFESSPEAIAIIDSQERILNINGGFEKLFYHKLDEVKGKFISIIVPDELSAETSQISRDASFGEIVKKETVRIRKDGSKIDVSVLGYPVFLKDREMGMCWVFSDISSRKRSEKLIHNSLVEKELLLKEVHHRVKNNLQIIGSLLKIQMKYIKDPEMMEIFKVSQNRIRSISLIHEKLYQTRDLSRIEFESYIKLLLTQLFITFGIKPDDISFNVNAGNIFLSVDNAVPCGLIINELVTNSLKYGFPGGKKGRIAVDISYDNSHYVLKVSDDGVGLPQDFDIHKPPTMGLQLVNMLAYQLDAQLSFENVNGASYTIVFSNLDYRNRI